MPPKKRARPSWEQSQSDDLCSDAGDDSSCVNESDGWDDCDASEDGDFTDCEDDQWEESDHADEEEAGHVLCERWLRLYAEGRMSAKDLCLN
eukprot:8082230-Pyramimonas_sp.AAC.1